jgi:hypothetical protein
MVGEPSDKALRALLDERVHLMIRINLVENAVVKNDELKRLLARHVKAVDQQISERRFMIAVAWQHRNVPKIEVSN